jgi:hypothetical protein
MLRTNKLDPFLEQVSEPIYIAEIINDLTRVSEY